MKTKSYSIKENFDKEIVEIWEEIKNIDHLKKYYEKCYYWFIKTRGKNECS